MIRRLIFLLILPFMACNSVSPLPAAQSQAEATSSDLEPHYCEEMTNSNADGFEADKMTEATVIDYELSEGCICITYQYSGCEEVTSYLTWDGKWLSQFHPVIATRLLIENPGKCDMLLTDSTCFSIKKLSFGGDKVGVTINEPVNRLDLDFTRYQ